MTCESVWPWYLHEWLLVWKQSPLKHKHEVVFPLLHLQGDEERKCRSGFEHGRQEAEELVGRLSGPRPDGKRWSGASQRGGKDLRRRVFCKPWMCWLLSRGSGVLCSQESAKKLEHNVYHLGMTVESLLYRYGKVTFDSFYTLEKLLADSPLQIFPFEENSDLSEPAERTSCVLMTAEVSSCLPIRVWGAVRLSDSCCVLFLFRDCAFVIIAFPKKP